VKKKKKKKKKRRRKRRDGEVANARSYLCWNSCKSLEVRRCAAKTRKNEKMKKGARVN
jgi:hypothetical protein